MATLTWLSIEVIEIILGDENVSIEDVLSFSATCRRFQDILFSKKFWKKKFYQRCPSMKNKYYTEEQKKICDNTDFKQQIEASLKYVKNLQYYVSLMAEDGLWHDDKIKLECLLYSIAANLESHHIYYFVIDEINRIISTQSLRKPGCYLTSAYNFGIILRYIKHNRLEHKQDEFTNMPKRKQLLERLLTIIVQYFEPHISTSSMKMCFDIIMGEILSHLKTEYPAHSIFSISSDQFSDWRNNEIDDNFWDETEARQIICILKKYFFSQSSDYILEKLLTTLDLKKSSIYFFSQCVDKYLLPFIYHIVARRLGIRYVLKRHTIVADHNIYKRIAIAWKPKYDNTKKMNNAEYFIINGYDNLNGFDIVSGRYISRKNRSNYLKLISFLLEDYLFFKTWNYEKYPWELNMIKGIIGYEFFNKISKSIKVKSTYIRTRPKIRNKKIKFAVGMIVKHRIINSSFDKLHFGVIVGWDFQCDYTRLCNIRDYMNSIYLDDEYDEDEDQHFCMSVEKVNQTHYIILTETNRICYLAQDEISICQPQWIDNIEIGRYFSRFVGTHYVPNKSLVEKYPNDIGAVSKILFNIN
ncbi:uncharacterized protein [Anoplolepis gracilipes]|uniref:uncharacterized protein n=1 Tax=Anoplolepis gracilipes TaxID=354296 RepID=UPI003BA26314